jgi:hypothetical protein
MSAIVRNPFVNQGLEKERFMLFRRSTSAPLLLLLFTSQSFASTLGFEIHGISTHFSEAVPSAPRKIDSGGVHVVNPGLGLDFDFRSSGMEGGFSAILRAGYFKDCQDALALYGGGGVRYRVLLERNYFVGGSLLGGIFSTETLVNVNDRYGNAIPPRADRTVIPLIVPTIEAGVRVFQNHTIKLNLSYAPVLDLMLTSVTFSYSLASE